MLVYPVNIEELPESCLNCPCHWCYLPMCRNRQGITNKVKKPYLTDRHKECPLIRIGGKEIE